MVAESYDKLPERPTDFGLVIRITSVKYTF